MTIPLSDSDELSVDELDTWNILKALNNSPADSSAMPSTSPNNMRNNANTLSVEEKVDEIHTWLHTEGVEYELHENNDFIQAYCDKVNEVGVPLHRFYCGASILHPQVAVKNWKWEYPDSLVEGGFSAELMKSRHEIHTKQNGPMMQMMNGAEFVRIRATDDDLPEDCQWMIENGYTDLFGLPVKGKNIRNSSILDSVSKRKESNSMSGGFTWSTKAPGGFTDDDIQVFRKSLLSLATVARLHIMNGTSKTLLMTYLGADAGSRVHRGEIERGDGLTIRSAIWFSDIRGFTQMSGELSRKEVLPIINEVFAVTVEVIGKHKGQLLKFMGDGCMAIFNSSETQFQRESFSDFEKQAMDDKHGKKVCSRAMLAAAELQDRLATLRKERKEKGMRSVSVGVGLHYGDCAYGNVGAPSRLDFTVIGPSVNLASRVESLCSKLHADVLATEGFSKLSGGCTIAWANRGEHQVKGVSKDVNIYELNHKLLNRWKSGHIHCSESNISS